MRYTDDYYDDDGVTHDDDCRGEYAIYYAEVGDRNTCGDCDGEFVDCYDDYTDHAVYAYDDVVADVGIDD